MNLYISTLPAQFLASSKNVGKEYRISGFSALIHIMCFNYHYIHATVIHSHDLGRYLMLHFHGPQTEKFLF